MIRVRLGEKAKLKKSSAVSQSFRKTSVPTGHVYARLIVGPSSETQFYCSF